MNEGEATMVQMSELCMRFNDPPVTMTYSSALTSIRYDVDRP
jgi:hypothetical protein